MDDINHIQNIWMQIRSSFKSYTKNGFENEKRTQRKVNDIKTFELRHFRRMCIVVICQSRLDSSTLYFVYLVGNSCNGGVSNILKSLLLKQVFFRIVKE